jgi:protein TonB
MISLSLQFKRDIKALLLTLIVYIPLIYLFYNYSSSIERIESVERKIKLDIFKPLPTVEHISQTSEFEDDTLDDLDEIMQEEEKITPEPIKKPLPPEKEHKVLTPKPKPVIRKKRVITHKSKPKAKKHKYSKKATKSKPKPKRATTSYMSSSRVISMLKKRIEKNKRYPKMAKRRGLNGKVSVKFKINKAGRVSNISTKGSKIFLKSAKSAIEKSFPIDTKGVKLPMSVNLILLYRLKF